MILLKTINTELVMTSMILVQIIITIHYSNACASTWRANSAYLYGLSELTESPCSLTVNFYLDKV